MGKTSERLRTSIGDGNMFIENYEKPAQFKKFVQAELFAQPQYMNLKVVGEKCDRSALCVADLKKIARDKNSQTVVGVESRLAPRSGRQRRAAVGGNILVDMAMMLKLRNPTSLLKEPKTQRDAKTHAKTHDTVISGWEDESRMSNVYQKSKPQGQQNPSRVAVKKTASPQKAMANKRLHSSGTAPLLNVLIVDNKLASLSNSKSPRSHTGLSLGPSPVISRAHSRLATHQKGYSLDLQGNSIKKPGKPRDSKLVIKPIQNLEKGD
jgi:hypothetical protein